MAQNTNGIAFNANVTQKPVVKQPVEGEATKTPTAPIKDNNDLDGEYLDKRDMTIKLVPNTSLYRKANSKVLAKRCDYIGSSVNASRILTSNKEEMAFYMPNILGISPTDSSFVFRVKQYFNNIQIRVEELGKTFDISFIYEKKSDYIRFRKLEDAINEEFEAIDRRNINNIKNGIKVKIEKLNFLESTKYKYGRPVNVEDYLMYRHCLLYSAIAKDMSLINDNVNIKFYFVDNVKEQKKAVDMRRVINTAKSNFVACVTDATTFEAVFIQYCVITGRPISASLAKSSYERENELDKFSMAFPEKFNTIYSDKDKFIKASIEKLIARGELIRPINNQNINLPEGELIGANMKEAVAWFKDPNNNSVVQMLTNKLKY